jgi:hypothetical protein
MTEKKRKCRELSIQKKPETEFPTEKLFYKKEETVMLHSRIYKGYGDLLYSQ